MKLSQEVDQTANGQIDSEIRRNEGDTVDFQVAVEADSVPVDTSLRFVWRKNQSEVRLGSRYGVHQTSRSSRLRISDLSTIDSGLYTCHVSTCVLNDSTDPLSAAFSLAVDEQEEVSAAQNLRDRIRNLHTRTEQREMSRMARRSLKRPYQCRHIHHHDTATNQRPPTFSEGEESRDLDAAPTARDAFRFWSMSNRTERANHDLSMNSRPSTDSNAPQLPSSSPPTLPPRFNSSFSSSSPSPSPDVVRRTVNVSATLNDVVKSDVATTLDQVVTSHDVAHPTVVSATANNAWTSIDVAPSSVRISATLEDIPPPLDNEKTFNGVGVEEKTFNDVWANEDEEKTSLDVPTIKVAEDEQKTSQDVPASQNDVEQTSNDVQVDEKTSNDVEVDEKTSNDVEVDEKTSKDVEVSVDEEKTLPDVLQSVGEDVEVEQKSEVGGETLPAEVVALVDDIINASVQRLQAEVMTSPTEEEEEVAVVNIDLTGKRKSTADDDDEVIPMRRLDGECGMSERAVSGVQFRHEQLPPEEIPFPDRVVEMKVGVDPWNDYEKLEKIGSGGFSEVFRCREQSTGLDLAAKVARYRASNKSSLLYEIDILRNLCHPRVMRLYDVFDHSRRIVLITEYVGGGELCERIIEDNFLSEEQSCNFIVQILRGVSYLHKQSIIHLDLKPENIVCTTKSSYDIKIIDFGFAQKFEGEDKPIRFLGGTANFTAPEVINYEPLTFAADVWAVGVIAFLLLSGYAPFDGDSDQEVLVNVTKGDYDYDDEVFDEISTTARQFIDEILIKNPSKRPTSQELLRHEWLRARGRRSTLHLPSAVNHMRTYLNRAREKWKAATTAIMAMQKFRRTQA